MNDKVNKKVLGASGISAIIFVACVLLLGIFEFCVFLMQGQIEFIDAGERWSSNGDNYATITMYTENSSAVTVDQVGSWAHSMDNSLLSASITPKEGARSWAYCYITEDTLSITGSKGSTTAEVMAVGGDFFVFHQMKFTYGSPFLNDDSNPMGIVIDRDLAWKVFGAENIIGMTVTINDVEFVVVGVVEKETSGGTYGYTYGDRPRMYMNYAGYSKIVGNNANITMFEVTLPNSVKSFAMNIFNGVVKMNEETTEIAETSDRFSITNRFNNMKSLKYSWIKQNKIEYPYWENEAKVLDYTCAVMMIFEVGLVAIGVTAMLLSFILLRVSGYTFTNTLKNTWQKIEKKQAKRKKKIRKSKSTV